ESTKQSDRADVLLENATLHDGTGNAPTTGDVAFRGGKIIAVGKFPIDKADLVLDCRGLIVAPGFIDLHNHSDSPIVAAATRGNVNFVTQGCTTIVTGNCGFGLVDAKVHYDKSDAAGAGTN